MTKFAAFLRDESGASAAEYVLILTIIGTTIAAGITIFGTALHDALERAAGKIDSYNF
jgi:pilus assembly protein Flp/PilA